MNPLETLARNAKRRNMDIQCDPQLVLDLIAERDALRAKAEQPAAQEPITVHDAYQIGAKGAEPTECERLLFEAWMRGHCWKVCGEWDGKTYVSASEDGMHVDHSAMLTRQLWAAWRDRAALSAKKPAERPASARSILTDEDMCRLRRFQEICEDSDAGGHDLPKEAVKRLERAGALRSCGFGRHEVTAFGDYLLTGGRTV